MAVKGNHAEHQNIRSSAVQRIYGMSQGGRNLRRRARCHRKWRVQLCYRGDTSERRRTHHRTRNTTATDADLPEHAHL